MGGEDEGLTYIQVYLKELASYQGKAGHGVLDTAQQTQGHQCWGERKGVSDTLLGLGANTPSPARQLSFFQKSPGLQVDSGQPLGPGSECSVMSGNAAGDIVSLMSSACHCWKWRRQLTAPVDATFMHPGVLLSVIRDRERGDVGRGVHPAACWGTAPWLLPGGDGVWAGSCRGSPLPARGRPGVKRGVYSSHLGCSSGGESITVLTQPERR